MRMAIASVSASVSFRPANATVRLHVAVQYACYNDAAIVGSIIDDVTADGFFPVFLENAAA